MHRKMLELRVTGWWERVTNNPPPVLGKRFAQHTSNMAHEVRNERFVRPSTNPLARNQRANRVMGRI